MDLDADDSRCDRSATRQRVRTPFARMGFTLVEVLVAVALILLLFTLVAVTTKMVQASTRRTRAQAQLQLLASAIESYTQAWPMWRDCTGAPVADRAWPQWNPAMLFPSSDCGGNPQYDYSAPSAQVLCGLFDTPQRDISDDDNIDAAGNPIGRDDVGQSVACVAYGLSVPAMGKKLLDNPDSIFKLINNRSYPRFPAAAPYELIRLPLDPWDNPMRYLWVTRDPSCYSGWRAITSADPVAFADPLTGPADPFFCRAQGFVLESAGPDGRFGNVWKRPPFLPAELTNAEDNLTIRP